MLALNAVSIRIIDALTRCLKQSQKSNTAKFLHNEKITNSLEKGSVTNDVQIYQERMIDTMHFFLCRLANN